jgi:lysophospholipase L1-like esterase
MTETERPTGPSPRVQFALVAATLVVAFALADVVYTRTAEPRVAGTEVVELRSPEALAAKLEYLRTFDGYKCVLLGDSIIVGASMREHGDADWRAHTLNVLLEERLREVMPNRPILVMNLGSNGAVPADLDELARIVTPLAPDLIIGDFGLRSFSADFAGKDRYTQPWLAKFLTPSPDRPVVAADQDRHPVDRIVADELASHWSLYRSRDLQQGLLFEGAPRDAVARWRDAREKKDTSTAQDDFDRQVELLFKARSRYASIDLSPTGEQRRAFESFVQRLAGSRSRVLLFYGTENPDVRDELLDPKRYADLRGQLANIIQPSLSERFRAHPGARNIPGRRYLDHVHIDADGYRMLVDELWPDLAALVGTP